MADIEKFSLPREDWYDTISTDEKTGEIVGRIYKDALIENFNAIENKLNEIASLDAFEVNLPDFSTISYDDVTLDSDDNKVVNLKSFLEITKCYNYPIELRFSGTTCTYLSFWTYPECNLIVREDQDTGASSTNSYIYMNVKNGNVAASNSATTPTDSIFIGRYVDGQIISLGGISYSNINVLWALSKMAFTPYAVKTMTSNSTTRAQHSVNNGGRITAFFDVQNNTPSFKFMPTDYGKTTR